MTFGRYFVSNLGEYLLVVLGTWCYALVAENAFFLSSAPDKEAVSLAVCAVLAAVLYAASYKRTRMPAWIALYVVLVAVLVASCLALSTGENLYEDAEGNYLYLAVVLAASATGSFLLTRTLPGAAVWFLIAAFTCSVVQAFYEFNALAASLGAVSCALVLVVYRNFRINLLKADVVRKASGAADLAASVGPVLLAGAAALAVWLLVIAPLSPGVLQIKLITDYRQLPIVEVRGVANEQPVLNLDLLSKNLKDGYTYTTDDLKEGASDVVINAQELFNDMLNGGGQSSAGSGDEEGSSAGLDQSSLDEQYDSVSYEQTWPVIYTVLIVLACIAAAIALFAAFRRMRRRKRLVRMLDQEPAAQVQSIYLFLLSRLERLGVSVPAGKTLAEFSDDSRARLQRFTNASHVDFAQLTRTYNACTFGNAQPTEDEIVPFVSYYLTFWKAARSYLGNFKYFFKSFRL